MNEPPKWREQADAGREDHPVNPPAVCPRCGITHRQLIAMCAEHLDRRPIVASRTPDPDALREAAEAFVQAVELGKTDTDHWAFPKEEYDSLRTALAAPAAPPDLAVLLHPWTCEVVGTSLTHEDRPDGGWFCQRAAADIAFRLGQR